MLVRDILERAEELSRVGQAAQAAAAGSGCVLLVCGEAGIGKSSLVAAARSRLPPQSRLLVGHCDDLATARPLGPLHDLAPYVGVELRAALAGPSDREALLRALWSELDRPGQGTVLAVEDVHWADDATLDVLRWLVRRIEALPAALLLTYRDELPRDSPVRQLLGVAAGAGAVRLTLPRLSEAAVDQLCRTAGVAPAGVHAVTAGNPYYVAEVLQAGASEPVPPTVVDAVLARVRALSPAGRSAVEQLSVVPAAVDRALVAALLPEGLRQVAEAEERGLVHVRDRDVVFRHELTRRAVVDALPRAQRAVLEAQVLAALLVQPVLQQARLVHHAAAAGDVAAVARHAPVAAREAVASGAHREAIAHFRLALQHPDAYGDAERADLLEGLAVECYTAGSQQEAVQAQQRAVRLRRALDDRAALGASLRWLSRMCWWAGDRPGAEAAGAEAVSVLEQAGDTGLLAMAYSNSAQLDMLADRSRRAVELSSRAIALARDSGDDPTLAHALCNLGSALGQVGDPQAGAVLDESLEVALRCRAHEHALRAYVNRVWMHLAALQPTDAALLLPAALALAEDSEHVVFHDYLLICRGMVELAQGRYEQARASVQPGLRSAGPVGTAALVVLGRVAVRTGTADPQLLERVWQRADESGELQRTGPAAAVLAEAAWLERGDDGLRTGPVRDRLERVHAEAVRAGRHDCADELGSWLRRVGAAGLPPARPGSPWACEQAGDWQGAALAWERCGHPYERAAALARSHDPRDALAGLALLDGLGAAPLAAVVRRDLRFGGVEHVPRGPAASTRSNPSGLTARQAEVLALVREGLTNAQIAGRLVISPRTADHHVSALLGKLGVASRTEAARLE